MVITFITEDELAAWGKDFGQNLKDTDVVFLYGPMGAGKTTLVRAMSAGYGVPEGEVSSPTFAIHNHMKTTEGLSVHHMDGYRIEDPLEYEQVGLDVLPQGPLFIEWPEKCKSYRATIEIRFNIQDDDARQLTISHA